MPEHSVRRRLRIKRIDRVALVDKGDNPLAEVIIHKRAHVAPDAAVAASDDDRSGLLAGARAVLRAIGKRLGWADAEVEQAVREVAGHEDIESQETDMAEQVTDKTAEVEKAQTELVAKLDAMEKRASDAEAEISKLRDAQREAGFVAKAKGWAHLPVEAGKFGPVLRKIADALTTDEYTEVERVLSAANEASRVSGATQELGSGATDESDLNKSVEAKVAEVRQADPKLTREQAMAKVYKADPALRAEVEADEREQRRTRSRSR